MIFQKMLEYRNLSLCPELQVAAPAFGPIGKDIINRSYARDKKNKQKESWAETCYRVTHGNCDFVDQKYIAEGEREALLQAMYSMAMIPAGRHISNTGIRDRQFVHNCHTTGWIKEEPFEHFGFTMKALMQGGGVGSNYSQKYIRDMPLVRNLPNIVFICDELHMDWHDNGLPGNWDFRKGVHRFCENGKDKASYGELVATYTGNLSMTLMHKAQGDGRQAQQKIDEAVLNEFIKLQAKEKMERGKYQYVRIEDNRQGWVDALEKIFDHAWSASIDVRDKVIIFDVSDVRGYGEPLKSFGGTASGPVVLIEMLLDVNHILESALSKSDFEPIALNPIEYMEIDHAIAVCVCAGGSRRSARMSMLHWKDPFIWQFIDCKQTENKKEKPHWTTNISVIIDDEFVERLRAKDPYVLNFHLEICKRMILRGEPGYWNISNASNDEIEELFATNPCGEQGLNMFDACDLGHFNALMMFLYPKSAEAILRLLTRFLIRATYADMTSKHQKDTVTKNRRIGVGFLGFADYIAMSGIRYSESWKSNELKETLKRWYSIVKDEAQKYSFELRIPMPVKLTTVAPTGTISFLPGVTPSCQAVKFKYFHRRVQFSKSDPAVEQKRQEGCMIEDSIYAKNTVAVSYWMKDALLDRMESAGLDTSILESDEEVGLKNMLEVQAMVQENWADNSVSFTTTLPTRIVKNNVGEPIKDEDPDDPTTIGRLKTECTISPEELADILTDFIPRLKGTTVITEGSYLQMPYERCSPEKYAEMSKAGGESLGNAEVRCVSGVCDI